MSEYKEFWIQASNMIAHDDKPPIAKQLFHVIEYAAFEKLKKQNEIMRKALDKFVNKSNVVTAYSRHGQPIHKDYIIDLYEAQLNAEQALKDVEGVK